ncbi:MAG: hypothetical protein KatS3mg114_0204 [Planctomycetaceae bacterium]|nr:MAG: hypothetical protein KatS3mg114_0204 [Planctomycetaceae bacterium]
MPRAELTQTTSDFPCLTKWCGLGHGLLLLVVSVGLLGVWWKWVSVSPEVLFQRTLRALHAGDASHLLSTVKRLQQHRGYELHIRLLDGVFFARSHQPGYALERLLPLPEPDSPLRQEFLLPTALALYEVGRLVDAEALLLELTRARPEQLEAWRWLGIIYYDLGAYDAAVAVLTRLSELDTADYRPVRLLGLMHQELELDEQAIPYYEEALRRLPPPAERIEIQQELAASLIALRRYEDAERCVHELPESGSTCWVLAQVAWNRGDTAAALDWVRRARQQDANLHQVDLLEAEILSACGEDERAIEVLQQALQRFPREPSLRYRLALTLKQTGQAEEAEHEMARWKRDQELVRELQRLNMEAIQRPRDAEVREQLAEVCRQLDKLELAAMWQRAAAACRHPSP